jgi:hypothetical protein
MNPSDIIIPLFLLSCLVSCSEPQDTAVSVDPSMSYGAFEDASKSPDANIAHDGDWTVVSRTENGNRVYWFVAPDVNQISPALFKKTIHNPGKNEKETVIVSKCDAPKQTCDDLMEQFKTLSVKYR